MRPVWSAQWRTAIAVLASGGLAVANASRPHSTGHHVPCERESDNGLEADYQQPRWEFRSTEDIEWVRDLGNTGAVLMADSSGVVRLIDLDDGRSHPERTVLTRPGVLPAEPPFVPRSPRVSTDRVVVFDRYRIYGLAIGLASNPKNWQYGSAPAAGNIYPGDPDDLDGWLAVCATQDGVFAVSRGGALHVLAPDTGELLHHRTLAPDIASAGWHLSGDSLVVVWRHAGRDCASFLRHGTDGLTIETVELAAGPLASMLVADVLFVLHSDGSIRRYRADSASPVASEASGFDVLEPRRFLLFTGTGTASNRALPLIITTTSNTLQQRGLCDAAHHTVAPLPWSETAILPILRSAGDQVLATTSRMAALWDPATGSFHAELSCPEKWELLTAAAIGPVPQVLVAVAAIPPPVERWPYVMVSAASAHADALPPMRLAGCVNVRSFHFFDEWLLAVEPRRISAYKLAHHDSPCTTP